MTKQIQHSSRVVNRQSFALILLLLLYLTLALAHASLAPLTTGPDELAHYEYANFIAEHGRLPFNGEERSQASYKSDQPPLYHLIAALPAGLVDPAGPPFLKRVNDHPRRQLIERTRHAWGLYNTEDEQWPYRAEVLRWHVGRWVAILFGVATVAVTYFIARELFAGPWPALSAAAVVAFTPRFVLTGSMLNYETTQAFFAALFLWVLLRMATVPLERDQRPGASREKSRTPSRFTHYALLLGVFTGLAITTKLSAIILPVEVAVAFWLIGRYRGRRWPEWLRAVAITAGATLAAVSWWFGFILYQFNTVAQDGLWVGLLRPLIAADASDATTNRLLSFLTGGAAGFTGAIENLDSGPPWEWLAVFFRTFWMVGIEGYQPLGWFGLVIALGLCLLAGYGLFRFWRRSNGRKGELYPSLTRHPDENTQYVVRSSTQYAVVPNLPVGRSLMHYAVRTPPATGPQRLLLSLLLLHLAAAFILPLARYAVTFSLADTAQGRHVLFLAAPAFAVLLIWGLSEVGARINSHAPRLTLSSRFLLLLPPLFLLLWTGVQLWSMTWAYHPLLPVQTGPAAKIQADHLLNQPFNDDITLVGYSSRLENGQILQLDLFWQATGLSAVDYLTEVSLLDSRGAVQAQWLGYPADGRYPTRAWDVGDVVRDTVWLPVRGLKPGRYELKLDLAPTTLNPRPVSSRPPLDWPLTLTTMNLDPPPFPQGDNNFQIWQNGRVISSLKTFRYRETILVTLDPVPARQERTVQIVGTGQNSTLAFEPVRDLGGSLLFMVGPDWPSGRYRVQVMPVDPEQEEEASLLSEPVIEVTDRWQRQFVPPPIEHLLEANFGNQIKLLGYELGANRVKPGGGLPVTLYWQGLDWMGSDYTVFTKLLAADQSVHGGRDRLPREGYSTLYWAPGEVITDPFGVPVDPDAPAGVYYLNVGLYKQVGEQAVSLPLVQDGRPIDATSVNIGPIKIGDAPPDLVSNQADPEIRLNQPFGPEPNLTLLGYDLTDQTGHPIPTLRAQSPTPNPQSPTPNPQSPIPTLHLTLYWRSEAPLPTDYTTFVHLRNKDGQNVAQKDQPPLNGAYPTSLWDPGEIIADEIVIPLPGELPSGTYELVVGLYDFHTGGRLPVPDRPDNSVILTDLELSN